MELNLSFDHGLGDCANFAHILELYRRRGFQIRLHCAEDKSFVFAPLELTYIYGSSEGLHYVEYPESAEVTCENANRFWEYNKVAINLGHTPLPMPTTREAMWRELVDIRLEIGPYISASCRAKVHKFLSSLPRPIVLLHSMGNTMQEMKNLSGENVIDLCGHLLDRFDGSLILLDWDDRVPRIAHWRVRHMMDDWGRIDVETLAAVMEASDLLLSVDSGPLHFARMTSIPVVGLFPTLFTYPSRMSLPRELNVNVVPRDQTYRLNPQTRILYNIVESPGRDMFHPAFVADVAAKMLAEPRYLRDGMQAGDIQLQQFVLEWERGHEGRLTPYVDRHRGFDFLLREVRSRFPAPVIVETGCVRSHEDWRGAGYSTYLLGAFAHRLGGTVYSVDNNCLHCSFAREVTAELKSIRIVHHDSVEFLKSFERTIDVLILDSMDTDMPNCAEHALAEIHAALPKLHEGSLICIDDTVFSRSVFHGNGRLAVPWLLARGWRISWSGYQTILCRA